MPRPFRRGGEFDKRERFRRYLFVRQSGFCWLCGEPMTLQRSTLSKKPGKVPSNFATFDHVIPTEHGGTSHQKNLKLACRSCNSARAHRFKETIPGPTVLKIAIGDLAEVCGSRQGACPEEGSGLRGHLSTYP